MLRKTDVQNSLRQAGLTSRYHTWRKNRDQSVAEHTWQLMRLYVTIFGSPPAYVLVHILWHDVGEVQTGDLPYPVKKDNPGLKAEMDALEARAVASMGVDLPALTETENLRFKFCDLLECSEFGIDEILSGNRWMEPVVDQVEGLTAYLRRMTSGDRTAAVHYCDRAGVPLDRGYLHEVSPLLANAYDNFYRESASGR